MYRCTECQTEYEVKPDYCDCGNDTFEEIKIEQKPQPQPQIQTQQQTQIKTHLDFYNQSTATQVKTQPETKKSVYSRPKPSVDMPSLVIFLMCIIMSFAVVFFIGNPKEQTQITKEEKTVQKITTIPSINTFWNSTPPKQEPVKQPNIVQYQQPEPIQPKVQVIPQPLPAPQPARQKAVTNIFQQQPAPKYTQPQKTVTPAPAKKTTVQVQPSQKPKTQIAQTNQQTAQQKQQVVQPQKTVQTPNKQEVANYKRALQNICASNMNFANVIGEGTCVVTFSISKSGAITNKKFVQQSGNFTLDNIVGDAVSKLNFFNPPPAGLKQTSFRLTVKFYGGNFDVLVY